MRMDRLKRTAHIRFFLSVSRTFTLFFFSSRFARCILATGPPASQPAGQRPASPPAANHPAAAPPASHPASQPASSQPPSQQSASQPANQPASQPTKPSQPTTRVGSCQAGLKFLPAEASVGAPQSPQTCPVEPESPRVAVFNWSAEPSAEATSGACHSDSRRARAHGEAKKKK